MQISPSRPLVHGHFIHPTVHRQLTRNPVVEGFESFPAALRFGNVSNPEISGKKHSSDKASEETLRPFLDLHSGIRCFPVRMHPGAPVNSRTRNERYPHYDADTVKILFRLAFETAQNGHFGTIAIREGGLARGIAHGFRSGAIQGSANHVFADFDTICSERLAISQVLQGASRTDKHKPPKIEALILSPKNPNAPEIHQVGSCGLCLESMQNEKAITPETLMISMARDPESGRPCIDMRPISAYLPYKAEPPQASFTERPIDGLSLDISPNARKALACRGLSDSRTFDPLVKTAMEKAKAVYELSRQKKLAERNNRYLGACALFLPTGRSPHYAQGAAFQATNRFFSPADINAAYQGLMSPDAPPIKPDDLTLVSYFGPDEPCPVRPANLTMLRHIGKRADIVIATIRDNSVVLRTIHDYQPIRYIKNKTRPNPFRDSTLLSTR